MTTERKVAVITGASQGIGAGLVRGFLDRGYRVVANSRSIKPDASTDVLAIAGDIADPAVADRVIGNAVAKFARIDTLVNNAGIFISKPFHEYTQEDFTRKLSVNLAGFFYVSQQAIRQMLIQGGGHIVNLTTTLVGQPVRGVPSALASLTKGGLDAVTRSLAIEYADKGIRVNAVAPGIIKTPMHASETHAFLAGLHPLGRMGEVSEIVEAVLYLESAAFVTGETLHVDGGARRPLVSERSSCHGHQHFDRRSRSRPAQHSTAGRGIAYKPAVNLRSFSTPTLTNHDGRDLLILTGAAQSIALDPATGQVVWFAGGPSEKLVCTPSVGHGLVFSFGGSDEKRAMAVRLGGQGDVSDSHVAWRCDRSMPYVPTPLLLGDYLHVMSDTGIYTCIDPKTGITLHTSRKLEPVYSSPVATAGRIYFFEDSGKYTVVENGPKFKVIATNEPNETVQTTPAVSDGQFFVRSEGHLICIGSTESVVSANITTVLGSTFDP